MADQPTAADQTPSPSPFLVGLRDYVQAGQAPQNFLEHPATAFIPILGPVLAAGGAVTRAARQRELFSNATYLHSLVASGELRDPQQVERLNLPDAMVKSALIQAERVRRSPEYQEGKIAQQLYAGIPNQYEQGMQLQPAQPGSAPSAVMPGNMLYGGAYRQARDQAEPTLEAQAFQDIAQRYPTIFASSSPKTADIGLQSRELEASDALSRFLGLPTGRGTAPAPSAPPSAPQRPLGASQSPPGFIPPSAPPATLPGPPTGAGQPAQPPAGQSSEGQLPSPAVLGARKAYAGLEPDVRQRVEDAVTAAVKDYPNVSREEALALAGIESQFNPNAQGRVTRHGWRAQGMMQLSPGVIERYGVQDPLNLEQNVMAGVGEYSRLKALYANDQKLALAAYNAGEGAVSAAKGVPRFRETQAYVNDVPMVQQWLTTSPYARTQAPGGQGTGMLVAGEGTAPGPQQPSGQAPALPQVPLPAPGQAGQTSQALPPGIDPLGQFNVRGQPVIIKQATVGVSGGKRHFDVVLQTPAERAYAYAGFWTLANPDNFQVALKDVTGKGIALDPAQVTSLQTQAVGPSLAFHYAQARADTRLSEAQARQQAATRTLQSIGVAPTPAQLDALGNPARLAGETTGAQRAAETAEQLSPQAGELRRQKPADEAAGKEQGRLASRVTSEQQANFLLPDGSSPPPAMTQKELEGSGARELGRETINHLDQVNVIQENLRTMQSYAEEYRQLGFGSKLMPDKAVSSLTERYEVQRRATARLLDKLANVGGERERTGGGGGVGIGPVRIGAFGSDMKQLLEALPPIGGQNSAAHLGEALATAQSHKDVIWRRAFGQSAP